MNSHHDFYFPDLFPRVGVHCENSTQSHFNEKNPALIPNVVGRYIYLSLLTLFILYVQMSSGSKEYISMLGVHKIHITIKKKQDGIPNKATCYNFYSYNT